MLLSTAGDRLLPAIPVDTVGRRFQVEWDSETPVTPLGQLVFFCQFLAAGGLYSKWVAEFPCAALAPMPSAFRICRAPGFLPA